MPSESSIDCIVFSLERQLPDCTYQYMLDNNVCFRKNDKEWFCIKFSDLPYSIAGLRMELSGPKPTDMDAEADGGYPVGDMLLFACMEEMKYVLRLARKYFIECGYETD